MTPDLYITPYIKSNFPLPNFLLSHLKEWHNIHSVIQDRTLEVTIYTAVVNTMCPTQIPCRNSEHIPKLGNISPSCRDYWPLQFIAAIFFWKIVLTWGEPSHGELSYSRGAHGQILTATGEKAISLASKL